MQNALFAASEKYFCNKEHLVIDYDGLVAKPQTNTRRIAEYLTLDAAEAHIVKAAAAIGN